MSRTNGTFFNRGSRGNFWTFGALSGIYVRTLYFAGVSVWPEGDGYKTNGFSVRCIVEIIIPMLAIQDIILQ